MPTLDHQPLTNFYKSIKVSNPRIASAMHADILKVAIFAPAQNKFPAEVAAKSLRETARDYDLPEALRYVLEDALIELGY